MNLQDLDWVPTVWRVVNDPLARAAAAYVWRRTIGRITRDDGAVGKHQTPD